MPCGAAERYGHKVGPLRRGKKEHRNEKYFVIIFIIFDVDGLKFGENSEKTCNQGHMRI